MKKAVSGITRPMPPKDIGRFAEGDHWPKDMVPAPEVAEWASTVFLKDDGLLYNEDHKHLAEADIAFMWAAGGFTKQMRQVIGQCEELVFRCSPFQKRRQEQQIYEWFGHQPDWLITLDANYAANCSDADFCALVEHELYHIGQEQDGFGQPKFDRDGYPKLKMRGHDVEEFVGIVARYGVGNPDGALAKMISAAKQQPEASALRVSQACGTCLLRSA